MGRTIIFDSNFIHNAGLIEEAIHRKLHSAVNCFNSAILRYVCVKPFFLLFWTTYDLTNELTEPELFTYDMISSSSSFYHLFSEKDLKSAVNHERLQTRAEN